MALQGKWDSINIGVGVIAALGDPSHICLLRNMKEKSLAAHRSGIDTILIPKGNVKDLDDIPEEVKESVHFIPVSTVKQVLNAALVQ